MKSTLGLSNSTIFLICGLAFIPLMIFIAVRYLAFDTTRLFAVTVKWLMYKVEVEGIENVPDCGVLVTPNHVSWSDGVLVGLTTPRHPRMVVFADYFEKPWLAWFGRLGRVIPIKPGRKSIVESLRNAREALNQGDIVCVFPEGGITRTGKMGEFQPGILTILKGTNAPVVPMYIEGMWGSIFSFEGGKFFWKIPKILRRKVTIRFGKPIYKLEDLGELRKAVMELGGVKE
jgi:acyl-[acyl-carrier-protein]-phospholipid O-acyltransferase/long-chain-fatty-acid--[acyl-carrier-protein] ligase